MEYHKYTNIIKQIINLKIKNRKKYNITIKNRIKTIKICQKTLNIAKIDKLVVDLKYFKPDMFPQYVLYDNINYLINLSSYLSQKINSQIITYRAYKKAIFVQVVAYNCAIAILKNKKINIVRYIHEQYDFKNFLKKEIHILPMLIIYNLIAILISLNDKLVEYSLCMKYYSNCKIKNIDINNDCCVYAVAKYNSNMFSLLDGVNVFKYTYKFLNKLNMYKHKFEVIINYIKYLDNKFLIYSNNKSINKKPQNI